MDTERISAVCINFNIQAEEVEIFRSSEKILAEVKSISTYVLKGERVESFYWEACCQYAERLVENGMNVARYVKTSSGSHVYAEDGLVFTLEKELPGYELTYVTEELLSEIGSLLGKQHLISAQFKSPFTTGTSWSMFGGNDTETLGIMMKTN